MSPDYTTGDPVELPRPPTGGRLGLYDPQSRLRAGSGPHSGDVPVRRAMGGEAVRGHSGGDLVVTVPVSHAEKVIGVVRASSPAVSVRERVLAVWAVLLGVAALALAVAVVVARRQARVLAAPLEELSRHCRAVTEGDLNARAAHSTSPRSIRSPAPTTRCCTASPNSCATNATSPPTPPTNCAPPSPVSSSPWRPASPRTTTPGCDPS
ncbi:MULTISPECIES: hypothetical protein [unclassified Streptomyces]|uniref:hypothetical protein n=1 Tax=unclassified Streptomyces TaxID=2593676 RepID=UPI002258EF31|nr:MULTISPECIES: hypothetical protein [unclassified Streptomyces]MCX5052570.1 hypothetical protein [Streptomyces sp. NBC_00474]